MSFQYKTLRLISFKKKILLLPFQAFTTNAERSHHRHRWSPNVKKKQPMLTMNVPSIDVDEIEHFIHQHCQCCRLNLTNLGRMQHRVFWVSDFYLDLLHFVDIWIDIGVWIDLGFKKVILLCWCSLGMWFELFDLADLKLKESLKDK